MLSTLAPEHTAQKMATQRKHAAVVDEDRARAAEQKRPGALLAHELRAQLDAGAASASAPSTRSKSPKSKRASCSSDASRASRQDGSKGSVGVSPESGRRALGPRRPGSGEGDVDSDDATTDSDNDGGGGGGAGGGGSDDAKHTNKKSELCFEYANLPKPCSSSSLFFASNQKTRGFLESLPTVVCPGSGRRERRCAARQGGGAMAKAVVARRGRVPLPPAPRRTAFVVVGSPRSRHARRGGGSTHTRAGSSPPPTRRCCVCRGNGVPGRRVSVPGRNLLRCLCLIEPLWGRRRMQCRYEVGGHKTHGDDKRQWCAGGLPQPQTIIG
jgi:hypothetical protein